MKKMYFIYDILFSVLFLLASPYFLFKAVFKKKYRAGAAQRFGFIPKETLRELIGANVIWIHAVSVGEVMAAAPIVSGIRERHPDYRVVISTVTETGNLTAKKRFSPDVVKIYFPLDFGIVVRRVLKKVNPAMVIIMETEIWPNFLRIASKMEVPVVFVNGRISNDSFKGYRKVRYFLRSILKDVSYFGVQTDEDARRIVQMGAGPDKVVVTGNTKFDQSVLKFSDDDREKLRAELGIGDERKIFVAGSTHSGEEEIILDVYRKAKEAVGDLLLILAPRHIERVGDIQKVLESRQISFVRRSKIEGSVDEDVIVLDTIGELWKIYSLATVVFIGGSLVSSGGHNIIEPASFGKAILFGPHMDNFRQIEEIFLGEKAGVSVKDGDNLYESLMILMSDREKLEDIGKRARSIIDKNEGAWLKNMELVERCMKK